MKLNKIGVILMGCLLLAGGSIQAQSVEDRALQELRADSSARTRFVTRATMYGVGYTNARSQEIGLEQQLCSTHQRS